MPPDSTGMILGRRLIVDIDVREVVLKAVEGVPELDNDSIRGREGCAGHRRAVRPEEEIRDPIRGDVSDGERGSRKPAVRNPI